MNDALSHPLPALAPAASLESFQQALGRHVRAPRQSPRPAGLSPRRLSVYSELVFNNLDSLLRPCFPVTVAVLGDRWPRLVRQFCREARCETPLFREVPGEFLQWLLNTPTAVRLSPWLRELAHYEWVELAVDVMDVEVVAPLASITDEALWTKRLRINPSLLNLAYHWPVHRIGPGWRPRKPQPTYVLVYRDPGDDVRFMAVTPVSARLLHLIAAGGMTATQACHAVAAELGQQDGDALAVNGLAQCRQWIDTHVILGVHP